MPFLSFGSTRYFTLSKMFLSEVGGQNLVLIHLFLYTSPILSFVPITHPTISNHKPSKIFTLDYLYIKPHLNLSGRHHKLIDHYKFFLLKLTLINCNNKHHKIDCLTDCNYLIYHTHQTTSLFCT